MSKKNGSDNNIVPNLKKLPLAEYFAALPKAENVVQLSYQLLKKMLLQLL